MTSISSFTRSPETEEHAARTSGPDDSFVDAAGNPDYARIRAHPDFTRLRRRLIRFTFPATAAFLGWYLTYMLLAAYARDFMSQRVTGSLTVGLLLGLSQFLTTAVIMVLYGRFARRKVDPQVAALRARMPARQS
jgi:uncharacterized membrane protein (DUF485 family)